MINWLLNNDWSLEVWTTEILFKSPAAVLKENSVLGGSGTILFEELICIISCEWVGIVVSCGWVGIIVW